MEMNYINGDLFWGKVKVSDIADMAGTPFYLYNHDVLKSEFKKIETALKKIDNIICYAVKANLNLTILKMIAEWGYGAEVVSGGELFLALKAGFKTEQIVFSGAGKSIEEIEYAVKNNILLFNAESWDEIILINKIAKKNKKDQNISVRINPDINPETHPYITTGLKGGKFGIEWKKLADIFDRSRSLSNIKIKGIHIHIGSQISKKEPFIMFAEFIKKITKIAALKGIRLQYINVGGGIGFDYENDFIKNKNRENFITPKKWADIFISHDTSKGKTFITEPGRFVTAKAGILVTKLLYKKKSFGKNFYIVDAGMNDFMRPSLYNAHHNIIPLKKRSGKQIKVDVVGPICETGDFFDKFCKHYKRLFF